MAQETSTKGNRLVAPERMGEEQILEESVRPRTFASYAGQSRIKENLQVFVQAAQQRGEHLDHVLLHGPPGLGKTTLAGVIAHEMGVNLRVMSGPAIERKSDLAGILTDLQFKDVLFIDEIHRLNVVVEESLYPVMEDFRLEIVIGEGPGARTVGLDLKPFTLIGATTRAGLVTSPLRSRFGMVFRLEYYSHRELMEILERSAQIWNIEVDREGLEEIAHRSRGTPRVANRLLRRVRDFAQVKGSGRVDQQIALYALQRLQIDTQGLDEEDRRLLTIIIERFNGGPVGLDTLAAALSESRDTLEEIIEPYLLQEGFLARTRTGRMATPLAYEHLGCPMPGRQGTLF